MNFLKHKKYAKCKKLTVIFTKTKNQRTEYCLLLTKMQWTTSVCKCPDSLLYFYWKFLLKDVTCMTPFFSTPFQPTLSNVLKPLPVVLLPLHFVSTKFNSLVSTITLILTRAIKRNSFKLVVISIQAKAFIFFLFGTFLLIGSQQIQCNEKWAPDTLPPSKLL